VVSHFRGIFDAFPRHEKFLLKNSPFWGQVTIFIKSFTKNGREVDMETKIIILEVINSDRPNVLLTLVMQEGSKRERWGICRERAESMRRFVGKSMSPKEFGELLLERLEMT
jgi:hypothetical protein